MSNAEIVAADIQSVSSLEAVQLLLARLGYDVSDPVEQTAVSLGVRRGSGTPSARLTALRPNGRELASIRRWRCIGSRSIR